MRHYVSTALAASCLFIALTGCNGAGLGLFASPSVAEERWEYRFERDDGDTPMNAERATKLGLEGWELVTVVHNTSSSGWYNVYTFKRRTNATPAPAVDNSGVPTVTSS